MIRNFYHECCNQCFLQNNIDFQSSRWREVILCCLRLCLAHYYLQTGLQKRFLIFSGVLYGDLAVNSSYYAILTECRWKQSEEFFRNSADFYHLQLNTHLHITGHIMYYKNCKQERKSKISVKDTDQQETHNGFKKFWIIDLSADGDLVV